MNRLQFNPVIVLRRSSAGVGGGEDDSLTAASSFDLFYDDGTGSNLLSPSMIACLTSSCNQGLLDQLTQIKVGGLAHKRENPSVSKTTIESMPTVTIAVSHVGFDSQCAICKEPLELSAKAREMSCNHIYHRTASSPGSPSATCAHAPHVPPQDAYRHCMLLG